MRNRRLKFNALRVPCPRCGVYEWRMCIGKGEVERKAFHAERHAKAKAENAAPKKPSAAQARLLAAYNKEWAKKRAQVFALKGHHCVYCGAEASHVDHQTPKARGGKDDIGNLVPCCASCNIAKGMMTLEEWRG